MVALMLNQNNLLVQRDFFICMGGFSPHPWATQDLSGADFQVAVYQILSLLKLALVVAFC
jgi:hypothetical protein